jgi:dTDP-glucose 4,6-dehydratase
VITNIFHNKALPIYGDGQQIRDWLYVEDHAYGIDLVLQKGRIGESYNIGGNNEWANIDIVKTISVLVEQEFTNNAELAKRFPNAKAAIEKNTVSLITYVKDRPGHDRRYAIDATKTNNELGYKPKESFETGIDKTVAWYLNNEQWWQSVMDGSYQYWVQQQYS